MQDHSRRKFLRNAGAGVAVVGAAAAAPLVMSERASAAPATEAHVEPADLEGPLVAYLRDAKTGEFSLMVGTREVRYTDTALAARMTRAAV